MNINRFFGNWNIYIQTYSKFSSFYFGADQQNTSNRNPNIQNTFEFKIISLNDINIVLPFIANYLNHSIQNCIP